MILDSGIVTIFRPADLALSGEMPRPGFRFHGQSWYGELAFETSPQRPTEGRREQRIDSRIRVLQDRGILEHDVAVLRAVTDWDEVTADDLVYRITRAYHGTDDNGPTPITDLTLEVYRR